MKSEVIIVQPKLSENRIDSFWYDGQIAIMDVEDGTYSLEATGEIEFTFDGEEDSYRNSNAIKECINRGLTDDDLSKVNWVNNNWFQIAYVPRNNNHPIKWESDVAYTYDEGIDMLKDIVKKHYNKQAK